LCRKITNIVKYLVDFSGSRARQNSGVQNSLEQRIQDGENSRVGRQSDVFHAINGKGHGPAHTVIACARELDLLPVDVVAFELWKGIRMEAGAMRAAKERPPIAMIGISLQLSAISAGVAIEARSAAGRRPDGASRPAPNRLSA
jgi:hypothetical protein